MLHDWEKDKNKKSIVEALDRREKHSLAGKRMIKPFSFLESLQAENYCLTNLNKPNKQDVYEIGSFNKFNFSQSRDILDTLIDVRNAKHQNTTS